MKRTSRAADADIDTRDVIFYRKNTSEIVDDLAVAGNDMHVVIDLRGQKLVPDQGGTPRGDGKHIQNRKHKVWGNFDPMSAARMRLTAVETRVLFAIMARVTREENIARISQVEIAAELHTTSSAVSRAASELKRRRFLFEDRRGVWRVSLWLYWRGEVTNWELGTKGYEEPIWDERELVDA